MKFTVMRCLRAGVTTCVAAAALGSAVACSPPPTRAMVIALSATAAEPAASLTPVEEALLSWALDARQPGDAMVDVIVSGRDEVMHFDLTPMQGDAVQRVEEKAEAKTKTRLRELTAEVSTLTSGQSGLDLLALLDRSGQHTSDGDSILVQSSGVQTVDPIDLRVLGWDFNADTAAAQLAEKNLVPDLSGRQVTFTGLGLAMGSQPTLTRPARVQVEQLWLAICRAGGAASCEVAPTPPDLTASAASLSVPVVPVGGLSTECEIRTLSVPAAATFAGDSAALREDADRVLAPIAAALRQCPQGAMVSVVGHAADPTAGGIDGTQLSLDRARAIQNRLVALGAPAQVFTDVRGVGDTEPKVENWIDGEFSEALASLNRRVDISMLPRR